MLKILENTDGGIMAKPLKFLSSYSVQINRSEIYIDALKNLEPMLFLMIFLAPSRLTPFPSCFPALFDLRCHLVNRDWYYYSEKLNPL